jgi:hypothetical protein
MRDDIAATEELIPYFINEEPVGYLSADEIQDAECRDIHGDELVRIELTDGRTVDVYSIDLDFE